MRAAVGENAGVAAVGGNGRAALPGVAAGRPATGRAGDVGGVVLNSEQLLYFELAYSERSFSAAARKVPVSHQGLTKSIRALERELGVTLFEPDDETGMPVPTAYADELYEFAAVMDSNRRLLDEAFGRLRSEATFTVNVGCSHGVLGAYGPGLIDDFMAAHPRIEVQYGECNDAMCERGLRDGQFDLAIVVSPLTEGCEGMPLYESPFYFWTRRTGPVARRAASQGRERLAIEDLEGVSVGIPGAGFKCCEQLKRVAAAHEVTLGRIFEMSEIFRLYEYAMDGKGVGFSNGTLVGLPVFNSDDEVVAMPLDELRWGFSIERLSTHALGEAERLFWDWCVVSARGIVGNELAK
jgi:DNA-binding transcriptional LysR family regulator